MSQPPGGSEEPAPAMPRPILKIRVNSMQKTAEPSTPATPAQTPTPKIKIVRKQSQSLAPSSDMTVTPTLGPPPAKPATTVVTTKSGRAMKATAKKRAQDQANSDDEPLAAPASRKRIRLATTSTVQKAVKLKVKTKGHPPHHPPGEGYDSEQEDREIDPSIEEQFVLRYEGGDDGDLEYLTQMVEQGRIGAPIDKGSHSKDKSPAQFDIKWLPTPCGRRAVVRIRGNLYAAVLLDLPTITESMKTWDKKNLMKSADICQMLLIFTKVASEQEAKTVALPQPTSEPDFRWPHGLTPPMHDAVQRRFRKRLTKKEVKDKEAELHRLLEADRQAASVRYEIVTIGQDGREFGQDEVDEDQDAEGEDEEELNGDMAGAESAMDGMMLDLAEDEDLNLLLEQELEAEAATPLPHPGGAGGEAITPAAVQTEESGEEDYDDDDDDDDVDEDAEGEAADKDDANELLAEAERTVAQLEATLLNTNNPILRKRLMDQLKLANKNVQTLKAKQADDEEED